MISLKVLLTLLFICFLIINLYPQNSITKSEESVNLKAINNFVSLYKGRLIGQNLSDTEVQKSLDRITDINTKDRYGKYPLEYTLYNPMVFNMFLDKEANVDLLWRNYDILLDILKKISGDERLIEFRKAHKDYLLSMIEIIITSPSADLSRNYLFYNYFSSIADIAEYMRMPEIRDLFVNYGAKLKSSSFKFINVPLINKDNIPSMACIVQPSINTKGLLSFESNPTDDYLNVKLPYMQTLFVYQDSDNKKLKIENKLITIFNNSKFNSTSNMFVVWNIVGDSLEFNTCLDHFMPENGVLIEQFYKIADNDFLLIGKTDGGDGGDTWGSVWIAQWKNENELQIISKRKWINLMYDNPQKIEYKFNPVNLIFSYEYKIYDPEEKVYKLNETETVDLKDIIKQ